MKIGVFDSGIGGLSVLNEAMDRLLHEEFVFYADTVNVPYGEKTENEIIGFADEAVRFLLSQDCKAIIIACNTATSAAAAVLRERYDVDIIGMEPAVKKAIDSNDEKRILVAATPFTIKGNKLHDLIGRVDIDHKVDLLPLPMLVRFAERGEFESDAVTAYLKEELSKFNLENYSALVLGCTHFNYFKDTFRSIMPETMGFIDGNEGTVNQLVRVLSKKTAFENHKQSVVYFESGVPAKEDRVEQFTNLRKRLRKMKKVL